MRRLLYDATPTIWTGATTGIPRVVRSLADYLPAIANDHGVDFAVLYFDGRHYRLVRDPLLLAPGRQQAPPRSRSKYRSLVQALAARARRTIRQAPALWRSEIWQPRTGDVLFLPDAVWRYDPWRVIAAARQEGVEAHGLIHDLLPLKRPDLFEPHLVDECQRWWRQASRELASYLCVSGTVAKDLRERLPAERATIETAVVPLGFDFKTGNDAGSIRADGAGPRFLMVGTLEPRKNHGFALDAFDIAWRSGGQPILTIVGRRGWNTDPLIQRILAHPNAGTQLVWLEACSDQELDRLYRQADVLVASSLDEGFGLPLLEAEARGLTVLASDIPVFREVAGPNTCFFPLDDPASLAAMIAATKARTRAEATPPPRPLPTWRVTAEAVFTHVQSRSERMAP